MKKLWLNCCTHPIHRLESDISKFHLSWKKNCFLKLLDWFSTLIHARKIRKVSKIWKIELKNGKSFASHMNNYSFVFSFSYMTQSLVSKTIKWFFELRKKWKDLMHWIHQQLSYVEFIEDDRYILLDHVS